MFLLLSSILVRNRTRSSDKSKNNLWRESRLHPDSSSQRYFFDSSQVNGTTQYVTSVPLIATIIERLQSITAPIIARFGKKEEDGSVSVDAEESLTGSDNTLAEVAPAAEKII